MKSPVWSRVRQQAYHRVPAFDFEALRRVEGKAKADTTDGDADATTGSPP